MLGIGLGVILHPLRTAATLLALTGLALVSLTLIQSTCLAQAAPILYQNDFQKAELDTLPDGFVVLDGAFSVKESDGNRFLDLPGAPLDTYGVLFGPKEPDGMAATARVFGTAKGRRFPVFALGVAGVSGFRLQVSPAKGAVELYRGDTLKTTVPYQWISGKWTHLRLQCRKAGNSWKAEGKVWTEGSSEPPTWSISAEENEALPPGQASLFGSPFSGTSIRFDDVMITRVSPETANPAPGRRE
jgi:hypothetical protein